ncbi:MAG: TlyA family RNA methyltransferase, partial [Pseudomonadota bacterium]|nr:TlyA family RNA methyltransferase [Pseudomonadota bacterium]
MIKAVKTRLDQLLFSRGLVSSRTRAQAIIMAGLVIVGDKKIDKPGTSVAEDAVIHIKGRDHPYVSRGGVKLAHALERFDLDPAGAVCADIGASTGGFADVLLRAGAAKVYAVDVGHGQLAWTLRRDDRVIVLERTNARYLTKAQIPEPLDWVVCDASFIGLQTILPAVMALAKPGAMLTALIKPQFEAGPDQVGKGGVVRDPSVHKAVCARIRDWLTAMDWTVAGFQQYPPLS